MKIDYENTKKIKQWLKDNNLQPSEDQLLAFRYYRECQYYGEITKSLSVKERIRVIKKQIDYIQKSMILILYEDNGCKSKGLKHGYVYAIGNPAWEDYVKVGCAVDVYDRLNTYQTSSPHRDYELIDYVFTGDRLLLEATIHSKFETKSEWVKASEQDVLDVFASFRTYPEKQIRDFAVKESINAFLYQHKNVSMTNRIRSVCKNYLEPLSEMSGISEFEFFDIISRNGFIKTYKSAFEIRCTPIVFIEHVSNLKLISRDAASVASGPSPH